MNKCTLYEISIEGTLSQDWSDWFAGVIIANNKDKLTILRGEFADQSALFGLLSKLHALNLTLISVCRLDTEDDTGG
jgi:hypothetical protein